MRKIKLFTLIALAFVACFACKSKTDIYKSPEKVADAFVKAYVTADFDNMYKYTVPANVVFVRNIQKSMRAYPEKLAELQNSEVEILNLTCKPSNDSLTMCKCSFKVNNASHDLEFRMKKIDGKWLVDMSEN